MDGRERARASAAKDRLARSVGGGSDQLAVVAAFQEWSAACRAGRERSYAQANFLSSPTMNMIAGMRTQLLSELQVRTLMHAPTANIHAQPACSIVTCMI